MNSKSIAELQKFQNGVRIALELAESQNDYGQIEMTALADLMQIECLRQKNTNLLKFTLPRGIAHMVNLMIDMRGVNFGKVAETTENAFEIEFANEDEQDKFIQAFEMMSFQRMRAYPTPDIFLNQESPDQKLCQDLIDFLTQLVNSYFGRKIQQQTPQSIKSAWSGAIYHQAHINDFATFPDFSKFEELDQPTRCYLIEYGNGYWKFFWSKPGQFGEGGNFITDTLKEDPPRNGDRYFNDAIEDQYVYSSTITLTTAQFQNGRSFIYKQRFNTWFGAFLGSMNPIGIDVIHPSWMKVFLENPT
jgi:hypothetical protein